MTYADSSFLVSLHLTDRHSPEAWRRMSSHPVLGITPFHRAEFAHAIFAHVFWKKISDLEAQRTISALENDIAAGILRAIDFPGSAFERSAGLARSYGPTLGVRTLDSLHVACALELGASKFWTFDERQEKLAQAAGLDTSA